MIVCKHTNNKWFRIHLFQRIICKAVCIGGRSNKSYNYIWKWVKGFEFAQVNNNGFDSMLRAPLPFDKIFSWIYDLVPWELHHKFQFHSIFCVRVFVFFYVCSVWKWNEKLFDWVRKINLEKQTTILHISQRLSDFRLKYRLKFHLNGRKWTN